MRTISLLLTLSLTIACSTEGTDADEERTMIGKADLVGSCTPNDCGDIAANGNCWCDEGCKDFGDCCTDVYVACADELPAPECNDGSAPSPLCDIKPTCEPGQVAARKNGCFQCVDALTCEAPAPEDCGDGSEPNMLCDVPPLCDAGAVKVRIKGCFQCVDPITCEPASTEPEDCGDGSEPNMLCDVPPICDAGAVKVRIKGCFECVDPATCEPA
jgi:hypothetical protein